MVGIKVFLYEQGLVASLGVGRESMPPTPMVTLQALLSGGCRTKQGA